MSLACTTVLRQVSC